MKVVLFCGGLGTRLKEHSDTIPKPMVEIGYRPLMWHLMRYYAHFGVKEFILCLGYRGDYIKKYFLYYVEWLSNDFEMRKGGREIKLYNNDIDDWALADGSAKASAKVPAQIGFWFFVLKDAIELHVARTLALIAAHPQVQARVRQEIKAAGPLTAHSIDGLRYLGLHRRTASVVDAGAAAVASCGK